jgi:hypothetical protein
MIKPWILRCQIKPEYRDWNWTKWGCDAEWCRNYNCNHQLVKDQPAGQDNRSKKERGLTTLLTWILNGGLWFCMYTYMRVHMHHVHIAVLQTYIHLQEPSQAHKWDTYCHHVWSSTKTERYVQIVNRTHPILNTPRNHGLVMFSRGFTHIWDHLYMVFGDGIS